MASTTSRQRRQTIRTTEERVLGQRFEKICMSTTLGRAGTRAGKAVIADPPSPLCWRFSVGALGPVAAAGCGAIMVVKPHNVSRWLRTRASRLAATAAGVYPSSADRAMVTIAGRCIATTVSAHRSKASISPLISAVVAGWCGRSAVIPISWSRRGLTDVAGGASRPSAAMSATRRAGASAGAPSSVATGHRGIAPRLADGEVAAASSFSASARKAARAPGCLVRWARKG
mmetsp:Transcript_1856/g.5899  ORF Transcript_1856/g.5899 Transcript_1856/m.5899 type:complete len:230 (+) Transcript_1856:979-1668(+)